MSELTELMGEVLQSDSSEAFGEFMVRHLALGDLAPGATIVFGIVVTAPATGTLSAHVRAASTTIDPLPGNNDGSADDHTVVTAIVPVVPPNSPPEVTDSQVIAYFGSPVTGSVAIADQATVGAKSASVAFFTAAK